MRMKRVVQLLLVVYVPASLLPGDARLFRVATRTLRPSLPLCLLVTVRASFIATPVALPYLLACGSLVDCVQLRLGTMQAARVCLRHLNRARPCTFSPCASSRSACQSWDARPASGFSRRSQSVRAASPGTEAAAPQSSAHSSCLLGTMTRDACIHMQSACQFSANHQWTCRGSVGGTPARFCAPC